jgi:hypothetical protein
MSSAPLTPSFAKICAGVTPRLAYFSITFCRRCDERLRVPDRHLLRPLVDAVHVDARDDLEDRVPASDGARGHPGHADHVVVVPPPLRVGDPPLDLARVGGVRLQVEAVPARLHEVSSAPRISAP